MLYLIILQTAVYVFDYLFTGYGMSIADWLSFDRTLILQGQVWRVLTFVAVPPMVNPVFMLFFMICYYSLGKGVEGAWGGFFFNLFYLIGVVGSIIGGFITGFATITFINLSIFLAYAALFPDATFLIMFIIPIKAKYLAYIDLVGLAIALIITPFSMKLSIIISLLNIVLFFWGDYYPKIRDKFRYRKIRQTYKREMRR
jgi:hypothetical protein